MDFGALLGLVRTRIDGLALDDGTDRHDALGHCGRGSLMRHYFCLLSLPLSPPALPGGMSIPLPRADTQYAFDSKGGVTDMGWVGEGVSPTRSLSVGTGTSRTGTVPT